jgi:3-methylcrotonyl-CoA carboxylase alpha subunit
MFSKILIANRGEIACRVIRTARRLGIATVAVYSAADRDALFVTEADAAWPIGPAVARESYLNIGAIVAAAQASGAEAVHPGYGFLSENADFAEACERAGLTFIGPPAAAMRAMGSKAAAKALMEAAGVPVVPGYHGADQEPGRLFDEARRIGFPVLIKASAGGGGRGMRIVAEPGEFGDALAAARREALGAFGDARMLLEQYLSRPRHIEVQVFADRRGNIVHIFDRDCSIQRRQQKVIEEAPAPGLDPEWRRAMAEAAIAAARAVGYVGAGTVEFIAEGGKFFFIEMNTRLQVEHTVSEAVSGLDLVEWQLRVAAGEPLPRRQQDLACDGHAIEARLYAEDPERDFLPQSGVLHRLRLPPPELARVDAGVRQGDRVSAHYDPLLAKIIAWGPDRTAAIQRLRRALAETAVLGLRTNLGFLARLAAEPDFAAGALDTGFIPRHRAALMPPQLPAPDLALAAPALSRLAARSAAVAAAAQGSGDPHSPWAGNDGWRLDQAAHQDVVFRENAEPGAGPRTVAASAQDGGWRLRIGERSLAASAETLPDGALSLMLDGRRTRLIVLEHGPESVVSHDGESWRLAEIDPLAAPVDDDPAGGRLTAPMPGRVSRLLVEPGSPVRRGQPLLTIEAMKMEHTILAPAAGRVERLRFAVGDMVEEGAELIVLAADPAAGPTA